jgi:hypothetical protein
MSARPVAADIVILVHQALAYFDVEIEAVTDLDGQVFDHFAAVSVPDKGMYLWLSQALFL